jgi:hypothetical protein
MAFVDMAFGTNTYNVTLFPGVYGKLSAELSKPTYFLVAGHKDNRDQIIAYDIRDVIEVAQAEGFNPNEQEVKSGDIIDMGGGVAGMIVVPQKPKVKVRVAA